MSSFELKITKRDWVYITIIGTLFGLFISLFFYFLNVMFYDISTIAFGVFSAFSITTLSALFISMSNNYILPIINPKFWYIISFIFSFISGAFGFWLSYSIFSIGESKITDIIEPYSLYLAVTVGSLTFLIGLILHQFIAMKHKHESIQTQILSSKIKALESELNPHFLFNALNSMSELVYIDPKKAEASILNLSKFLRNAIKIDSIIDIIDEIEMVKTYVEIENIRFEDRIKLHIDNRATKNIKLPKFSIQLLVENAIKHGYENRELNINIDIDRDIYISNDGKVTKNLKFGIGLLNLNSRLNLLNIGELIYEDRDIMRFKIEVKR